MYLIGFPLLSQNQHALPRNDIAKVLQIPDPARPLDQYDQRILWR